MHLNESALVFFCAPGWRNVAPKSPSAVWGVSPPPKLSKFSPAYLLTHFLPYVLHPAFTLSFLLFFSLTSLPSLSQWVCVCFPCSWHAEQCEYPVLMLCEGCQVRGQGSCVWGKWGRQHGDSRLAALHKQPAFFCYCSNILWFWKKQGFSVLFLFYEQPLSSSHLKPSHQLIFTGPGFCQKVFSCYDFKFRFSLKA